MVSRNVTTRGFTWLAAFLLVATLGASTSPVFARIAPKSKSNNQTQSFRRQLNQFSNMEFYYTNSGMLFYRGNGNDEGLFWPRGSGNSYIFGGGIWFATKKQIQGKRKKLCELGYNPNSGAGWYVEGEKSAVDKTNPDQTNYDSKFISYVSPRYDKTTGRFAQGSSSVVPPPYCPWPLWDTATDKTLFRNFYFGDYISDVNSRNVEILSKIKSTAKPAMVSEEDIVNIYTDADTKNNPEFRPGQGYPFGLDFQEVVYSWSFGRYRDMVFVRYRIQNSSEDSLIDCWIAPAFDCDLAGDGSASNDFNSYVTDTVAFTNAYPTDLNQLREPYKTHPSKLNMAYQYRNTPVKGQLYGMLGMSFLESPVVDPATGNIIPNEDSAKLGGYVGPNSYFQKYQQGLVTFRTWNINNDPSTQDLRYDFVSARTRDLAASGPADQRMCMGTGPFTMPPHQHVETTVAFTIAKVSPTDSRLNFGALLELTDFAHQVFGEPKISSATVNDKGDSVFVATVDHFLSPIPPNIPTVKTQSLDRSVLITWDSAAEHTWDVVSGNAPHHRFDTVFTQNNHVLVYGVNKIGKKTVYKFNRDTLVTKTKKFTKNHTISIVSIIGDSIPQAVTMTPVSGGTDSTARDSIVADTIVSTYGPVVKLIAPMSIDSRGDTIFGGVLLSEQVPVLVDAQGNVTIDPSGSVQWLYRDTLVYRTDTTLPFAGYQLWRTTRSDHDSTIRPDGINPNVLLKTWSLYDYALDSVFYIDTIKSHYDSTRKISVLDSGVQHLKPLHYRRKNDGHPHTLQHQYLDVGDDNHDGVLTGTEGLLNGVPYYYYVLAFDEYDSLNQVGPLFTAVVPPKNFVKEIPSKPPTITQFTGYQTNDLSTCLSGGLQSVRLDVFDSTRFQALYTNDTISVSFQPRWIEFLDQFYNQSMMQEWVDVTDTRRALNNTYKRMHDPGNATEAYNFPKYPPGSIPYIMAHRDGMQLVDTSFTDQFTTDNSAFAPNQTIDQTFRVLADLTFTQDSDHYSLDKVTVTPCASCDMPDTGIMSLSLRTALLTDPSGFISNVGKNQNRPTVVGALGNETYEVSFGNYMSVPGSLAPTAHGQGPMQSVTFNVNPAHSSRFGFSFSPYVMPVTVRLADCPDAVLRHVEDSSTDLQKVWSGRWYRTTWTSRDGFQQPWWQNNPDIKVGDPDTMKVPIPGWFELDAYHYYDDKNPFKLDNAGHSTAILFDTTIGPFYWPLTGVKGGAFDTSQNIVTFNNKTYHHLVAHRLKVGGAEIIFNAPEVNSKARTGARAPLAMTHMNDFQPGDKITLSFSGITKNLPFPGAKFRIVTPSGQSVDAANASLYTQNVLDQVQVVPNPYIVRHEGQTSTDNAKLFFTRLPPRATIEIYALDGTLINTLEHYGYRDSVYTDPNSPSKTTTTYFYNEGPGDRNSVQEWNLLTAGRQRVGSQVLIARIIAKDPLKNDAVIGEATTKFAIVAGVAK
jgi:hypothetical protein